ncbi:hypothetical protein FRC17_003292 [Serendipita sp. 399]|nr:hypothetical protein FRC17_003292 [Serendipita sp. 399]
MADLRLYYVVHRARPYTANSLKVPASTIVSSFRHAVYEHTRELINEWCSRDDDLRVWKVRKCADFPHCFEAEPPFVERQVTKCIPVKESKAMLAQLLNISSIAIEMDLNEPISSYFPDPPCPGALHIVLQGISNPPMGKGFSPETTNLASYKYLRAYIKKETSPEAWKPAPWCPTERKDHILRLKMPVVTEHSQFAHPSTLLHRVGQLDAKAQSVQDAKRVIQNAGANRYTIVCNTPGSGKTRVLLEALCQTFGFYLVAKRSLDKIGSKDMEQAVSSVVARLKLNLPDGLRSKAPQRIGFTHRRFVMLYYARMVVFCRFLEILKEEGLEPSEYKREWLLFQLQPHLFCDGTDLFEWLAQELRGVPFSAIRNELRNEETIVFELIGTHPICVLDEAQELLKDCDSFRSEKDPQTSCLLLRAVMHAFLDAPKHVILSGTGISVLQLKESISSLTEGLSPAIPVITDIGSFRPEVQQFYLESYLPEDMLNDSELLSRITYWLQGRYYLMSKYIELLIVDGFRHPHQVLDFFTWRMAGCFPSASMFMAHHLIAQVAVKPFDVRKIAKDPDLEKLVAAAICDHVFTGQKRIFVGEDAEKLVECGIGRFLLTHAEAQIDEPLFLVAAMDYFKEESAWTTSRLLLDPPTSIEDDSRGHGFERYGAFLLACAFKSARKLSQVFKFHGSGKFGDTLAQIVVVERINNQKSEGGDSTSLLESQSFDLTSDDAPSYVLGRKCDTLEATISWLENPEKVVFCFPSDSFGLHLVFLLRTDEGIVPTLVQITHTTKELDRDETEEANRVRAQSNQRIPLLDLREVLAALKKLCTTPTSIILRVFIQSHPSVENEVEVDEVVVDETAESQVVSAITTLGALENATTEDGKWVLQRLTGKRKVPVP